MKELNANYNIQLGPDGEWGVPTGNGSWSGLVGYLARKEADMVVAALSRESKRDEVIDFSLTVDLDELTLIVRKQEEGPKLNVFAFWNIFR